MDLGREQKDRAAAFLLNGKLPAALEEFKKAVALDPQDLLARRKVAEAFARMGRIEDAIAAYQGLAGRYAVAGHLLEAIAVGKVILQLDPHHQQTQQALAQFAERREQKQREGWHARLPTTMTALIEQERLREAPAEPTPSVDVEMTGGLAEPFPELPRELMVELLQRLSMRSAAQGEAIVVEGERGASMFVLAHGKVQVVRQVRGGEPRAVDEMEEGSIFGEIALLAEVPRVASVIASEESLLLEVSRELLDEMSTRHKALPALLQRFYKERLLANLLRSSELFRTFSREALARLAEKFELKTAERGDELMRQGDNGRGLFVLLRGRCVAYDVPTGEEYPELSEGAVLGEISLLELCPATATVRAETRCVLLFLSRQDFAEEVLKNAEVTKKLERIARERLERSAKLFDHFGGSLRRCCSRRPDGPMMLRRTLRRAFSATLASVARQARRRRSAGEEVESPLNAYR
jgi:CRP-like cAMP-binding protein